MDAELVLDAKAELGEGPVWDDEQHRLIWLDIMRGRVHWLDPGTDADDVVEVGQPVGAVALRAAGGLVLAVADGFGVTDEQGHVRMVADTERDVATNRMNDGGCDPAGRFLAGTMAYEQTPGAGTLYRLDADLRVDIMLRGVTVSNGLDWSDDGRTMYYIDSPTQGVDAFDYDVETGTIRNRRRVIDVPDGDGTPDGMTVDGDGCLWVALHGGSAVRRYTADGRLDRVVNVPASQVTSCCFGGTRLDELYITTAAENLDADALSREPSAGGLFACRPGVSGRLANRFAG